jgi:hypothetical protein
MAQKVTTTFTDDVDSEREATNLKVPFSFDGVAYEIDVDDEHYQQMKDQFGYWASFATKVGGRKRQSGTSAGNKTNAGLAREWLRNQGEDLPDRGRIPKLLMARYEAHVANAQAATVTPIKPASKSPARAGAKAVGTKAGGTNTRGRRTSKRAATG